MVHTRQYVNGLLRGQWLYDPTNNKGLLWDARQYQNPDDAGNNQGVVYQRSVYDQWGRKTQDQTLIPDPNTSNLLRMRSVYTLRDDGQPSSINHPSGTYYQYGYRVNYGFNPRTGQAETLTENGGNGQVIVSDVNWNQAGQVFEHKYGSGALDVEFPRFVRHRYLRESLGEGVPNGKQIHLYRRVQGRLCGPCQVI